MNMSRANVIALKAARAAVRASNLDRGHLRRARAARRSWHARKAAWAQAMLRNLDPTIDARADLAADRAADWNEAGF